MILNWHYNSRYPADQIAQLLGIVPSFIRADDPRPAHEQIDERYAYGGGWDPHLPGKWQMNEDLYLIYPGDPPLEPLAFAFHGKEQIIVYPHDFVAILTGDAFSVARLG